MCAALSLGASVPRVVQGQRVLGVGEDATVIPRGAVRVTAQGSWATYNQLYGPGGVLQALGAPLTTDSLGAKQLEILRPLQTSLRTLAQLPNAEVSLGPMRTDFSARIARSAFVFDLGLTSRIMLTARVPYEHTISEIAFDVNPRNELTNRPNIGVNPALTGQGSAAAAQNRKIVDSLLSAATEVSTRLRACGTAGGDPVCGDQTRAQTLVNDARAVALALAKTYGIGVDTARGAAFVPMATSTIQSAIDARLAALNTSFKTFIPTLSVWDKPVGAQAPVSSTQASALISDPLGLASIGLVERSHLGDVEVGAKVLLFDTYGGMARARASRGAGFRLAVGGLVRLGTGQVDRPNEIADVGTGDGQTDIEGNGALDMVLSRRFWASFVARYGVQLPDEKPLRIPDVSRNPFLGKYREQTVSRDLGDYIQLEASPRYVYNDYLSLSLNWLYRRKGEDKYTGTFTAQNLEGQTVTLDASILDVGTLQTDQRVGGGLSFSTLRSYDRGRAGLPIEVQLLHWQTVSGSGYLPKQFSTQVQLRYYTRLFGAPLRPAPATGRR